MGYTPPFVPESRKDEPDLHERIARARKAREAAAARVRERYANIKPDNRMWRTHEELNWPLSPPRVR